MTLVKEVGQDLDQSLVIHATVHILIVQVVQEVDHIVIPLMTLVQVLDLVLTVGHVIDRGDTDLVPTVVHPTIVVQVLVHIGVVVILDQDPVMIPILEVGVARLVIRRQEVVHGHIHVIVLTAVKDHTLLCHIQVKIVRRS
jgi:hypothetical protein